MLFKACRHTIIVKDARNIDAATLLPLQSDCNELKKQSSFRIGGLALLSLTALFILAGCGGGGAAATSTTPPTSSAPVSPLPAPTGTPLPYEVRPGTWVVMGSSTAAGNGAPAGKGWVSILQGTLGNRGVHLLNIARPSTVTYQGLSISTALTPNRPLPDPTINIDQALSHKAVALILAYPTNDTGSGYSSDETVNNLMAIRATALDSSVPVMILSAQPRNFTDAERSTLKDINAKLASRLGSCFINVYDGLAGADGRLRANYDSGDGTHPNEAGHQLIASIVQATTDSGECIRMVP